MISKGEFSDWDDPETKKTTWADPISMEYHMKQWREPKESTKSFSLYFSNQLNDSKNILDIGAGAGAATFYLAERNLSTNFLGIDYSQELINTARSTMQEFNSTNLSFEVGDWFNLEPKFSMGRFDGVVSLQTLSWLPEMRIPMTQIFKVINPNWIGISSLFYEGDISCKIEVFEHAIGKKVHYNIYSLKNLNRLAHVHGYEIVKFQPFEIGIDIAKPENIDQMGTFTRKITGQSGDLRLQFSGPLLMNWYFVLLRKVR
jgi:SAM-dependent methyltransferase